MVIRNSRNTVGAPPIAIKPVVRLLDSSKKTKEGNPVVIGTYGDCVCIPKLKSIVNVRNGGIVNECKVTKVVVTFQTSARYAKQIVDIYLSRQKRAEDATDIGD